MLDHKPTQKQRVLDLLRERGNIGLTALEALEHVKTMRLAAYVKFLKDDGYDISSEIVEVPGGKHVARYRLIDETDDIPDDPIDKPRGLLFDVSKDAARM